MVFGNEVPYHLTAALRPLPSVTTYYLYAHRPLDITICSGGENIIHYLSHDCVSTITVFDMNKAHLDVCKQKLSSKHKIDHIEAGRFEFLFTLVREYFINYKNEQTIVEDYAICRDSLNYVIELVFDNTILSTLFSDEATKYSKQSFSEHFKKTYEKMLGDIDDKSITTPNSENMIFGKNLKYDYSHYPNSDNAAITYLNQSAETVLLQKGKFHLIDLSNIGDWIPYTDFIHIVNKDHVRINLPEHKIVSPNRPLSKETIFMLASCHKL